MFQLRDIDVSVLEIADVVDLVPTPSFHSGNGRCYGGGVVVHALTILFGYSASVQHFNCLMVMVDRTETSAWLQAQAKRPQAKTPKPTLEVSEYATPN